MKKLQSWILFALLVVSCSDMVVSGNDPVSAGDSRNLTNGPVDVLSVESYQHIYQGSITQTREILVRVQDLGEEKELSVWGETSSGTWETLSTQWDTSLVGPAGNGYELYKISIRNFPYLYNAGWGSQFVVRYDVNGETFWANNRGANYSIGFNDGMLLTNSAGNVQVGNYQKSNTRVWGNVFLRNISANKSVEIVYTNDGWNTVQSAFATYVPTYNVGYAPNITNPNLHDVERWPFSIDVPEGVDDENFQFAVKYEAFGVGVYWANNYQLNFGF